MILEFGILEVVNWQPLEAGSITVTFDVRLSSGLTIRRFNIATSRSGRQCLNLPSWRAIDATTGQRTFEDVIGFEDDSAKERFKAALMAAVDQIGGDR
jgi:hypothetical protein